METKCYIVVGCAVGDGKYADDGVIEFAQSCGSVTEVCKYLKKMYNFPEKESRKMICEAFIRNVKLWIQVPDGRSVRISQHKMESEVRLHGCW